MINISENVEIKNLDKLGCTKGHIQACLWDNTKVENVKYSYCGTKVQRGTVDVKTCKGTITLKFDVKDGWARFVEIVIL